MTGRKRKTSPMVVIPFKETKIRKTSMKKVRFDVPASTASSIDNTDDFTIITTSRERMPSPMVVIPYKETPTSNPSKTSTKSWKTKYNDKKNTRRSFLDLPCEIRHAILVLVKPSHNTWRGEKELMRKRRRILGKVHPGVEKDMVFVEAVWRVESHERWGGAERGVRSGLFGRREGFGMTGE